MIGRHIDLWEIARAVVYTFWICSQIFESVTYPTRFGTVWLTTIMMMWRQHRENVRKSISSRLIFTTQPIEIYSFFVNPFIVSLERLQHVYKLILLYYIGIAAVYRVHHWQGQKIDGRRVESIFYNSKIIMRLIGIILLYIYSIVWRKVESKKYISCKILFIANNDDVLYCSIVFIRYECLLNHSRPYPMYIGRYYKCAGVGDAGSWLNVYCTSFILYFIRIILIVAMSQYICIGSQSGVYRESDRFGVHADEKWNLGLQWVLKLGSGLV